MIDEQLLPLLCCPLSRQPLALATPEILARLAAGTWRNRAGQPLPAALEGGLVSADGARFFPIRAGIPLLVAEESVELSPR